MRCLCAPFHDFLESEAAGLDLVLAKRTAHLIAGEIGCLARLLNVEAELDHVEEELEEVLLLRVAALDGEAKERPSI